MPYELWDDDDTDVEYYAVDGEDNVWDASVSNWQTI